MAQMKEAINQRVYDVSACGGFVLSDFRPDLGRLFELGKEVVGYRNREELKQMCNYFLRHPDEREEMAKRAQKRVLEEHTYKRRMEKIIKIFYEIFN
jgi:spore maturation protein CgeB